MDCHKLNCLFLKLIVKVTMAMSNKSAKSKSIHRTRSKIITPNVIVGPVTGSRYDLLFGIIAYSRENTMSVAGSLGVSLRFYPNFEKERFSKNFVNLDQSLDVVRNYLAEPGKREKFEYFFKDHLRSLGPSETDKDYKFYTDLVQKGFQSFQTWSTLSKWIAGAAVCGSLYFIGIPSLIMSATLLAHETSPDLSYYAWLNLYMSRIHSLPDNFRMPITFTVEDLCNPLLTLQNLIPVDDESSAGASLEMKRQMNFYEEIGFLNYIQVFHDMEAHRQYETQIQIKSNLFCGFKGKAIILLMMIFIELYKEDLDLLEKIVGKLEKSNMDMKAQGVHHLYYGRHNRMTNWKAATQKGKFDHSIFVMTDCSPENVEETHISRMNFISMFYRWLYLVWEEGMSLDEVKDVLFVRLRQQNDTDNTCQYLLSLHEPIGFGLHKGDNKSYTIKVFTILRIHIGSNGYHFSPHHRKDLSDKTLKMSVDEFIDKFSIDLAGKKKEKHTKFSKKGMANLIKHDLYKMLVILTSRDYRPDLED